MSPRDLAKLATQILTDFTDNDGPDPIEAFEAAALAEALSEAEQAELAEMLDLCPVHHCDVFICADDAVEECADARSRS